MAQKFNLTAQLNLRPPTNLGAIAAQIRSQLGGINTPINVTVPPRSAAAVRNINQQIRNTTTNLNKATKASKSFTGSIVQLGARYLVLLRIFGEINRAITDNIKIQDEFLNIAQIRRVGLFSSGIQEIEADIRRLGSAFGSNTTEVAKGLGKIEQAGISTTGTIRELLSQLDLSQQIKSVDEAARGFITLNKIFGQTEKQSVKTFSQFLNASKQTSVNVNDLIQGFTIFGSTSKAAGQSVEETIAIIAKVSDATQRPVNEVARGLTTIAQRLESPESTLADNLAAVGVSLFDINKQSGKLEFVGIIESVRRAGDALNQLPEKSAEALAIIEELGGKRRANIARGLASSGTDIVELSDALESLTIDEVLNDAELASEAFSTRLAKLRNEFKNTLNVLSNNPQFQDTIRLFESLAKSILGVVETLAPLLPLVAGLALSKFAGLGKVIPGIASGIRSRTAAASGLSGGFRNRFDATRSAGGLNSAGFGQLQKAIQKQILATRQNISSREALRKAQNIASRAIRNNSKILVRNGKIIGLAGRTGGTGFGGLVKPGLKAAGSPLGLGLGLAVSSQIGGVAGSVGETGFGAAFGTAILGGGPALSAIVGVGSALLKFSDIVEEEAKKIRNVKISQAIDKARLARDILGEDSNQALAASANAIKDFNIEIDKASKPLSGFQKGFANIVNSFRLGVEGGLASITGGEISDELSEFGVLKSQQERSRGSFGFGASRAANEISAQNQAREKRFNDLGKAAQSLATDFDILKKKIIDSGVENLSEFKNATVTFQGVTISGEELLRGRAVEDIGVRRLLTEGIIKDINRSGPVIQKALTRVANNISDSVLIVERRIGGLQSGGPTDLGALNQPRGFGNLGNLGTGGFGRDVARLSLPAELRDTANDINTALQIIPKVLSEGIDESTFREAIKNSLEKAGVGKGVVDALEIVLRNANFQELNKSVDKTADAMKLLSDTGLLPVIDVVKRFGEAIEDSTQALLKQIQDLQSQRAGRAGAISRARGARDSLTQRDRRLEGLGPVGGLSNRTAREQARNLTGIGEVGGTASVDEIARRLGIIRNRQRAGVDRGGGLDVIAQNLKSALEVLGDSAKRTASDVQKLGAIEAARASKISVGERFLGGDTKARREIIVQLAEARNLVNNLGGDITQLSQPRQGAALSGLRTFGEAIVPGGEKTGNQLADEIVARFLGGGGALPEDEQRRRLNEKITKTLEDAAKALEALAADEEAIFNRFIDNLGKKFDDFLKELPNIFGLGPRVPGPGVPPQPPRDPALAPSGDIGRGPLDAPPLGFGGRFGAGDLGIGDRGGEVPPPILIGPLTADNVEIIPTRITPVPTDISNEVINRIDEVLGRRPNQNGVGGGILNVESGNVGKPRVSRGPDGSLIEQPGDLASALEKFGRNSDTLAAALSSFPSEVVLKGEFKVEVIHNGAQLFAELTPQVQALVTGAVTVGINNMLKDKFPDVGIVE